MAMPTSTNEVTARRIASLISRVWDKMKSIFLSKSGDTMTGRLTLERPLSQVITGTGIAAVTTSPYYPARWKFNLGIANPTPGDQLLIKLPVAGHDYGCFISTDNGTTYYPVARSTGTTRLGTQYGAGACVLVVFEEYVSGNNNAGRVDSVFPPTGGTSRQNYTIGCWRLVNTRDDNDQYGVTEAYCSTGASTAAKTATSVGYSLSAMNNIPFRIRFTNANSAKSLLTLSINSQTAKNIYIDGAVSSSSNYTIPAGVYWCYYDGTQFQLWTDGSMPAPKGLRGNAATASAAQTGSALETAINGKQDISNLAQAIDLTGNPSVKYPSVWAVHNAVSAVIGNELNMTTAYVEAMHVATSYSTANFINVGMYDYTHNDDAVYYPTSSVNPDGVIGGGTFDSIVQDREFSWFPCSRGAQEFYIYHLWTADYNGSFHLENLFITELTSASPARRFRLVITNDCDYKFNLTFDKNTGSTDIIIMSNIAETSSSSTVEIPGNSTIAIDVLIPRCFAKFGITQMVAVIRVYPVVMQVHNSKVSTVYNMNDFTNPGTYQIQLNSGTTNKPTSVNGRTTLQVTNSNGYINQMILDESVYYRIRTTSGSWGAWKKFTTETA